MIAPTTPTGSRTISELPTSSSQTASAMTCGIEPKLIVGSPAWIMCASLIGMPSSCAISAAISSIRALSACAIRASQSARSSTVVSDHVSNAARAAATARSTSSALPSGMLPITCSVVELMTSITPLPEEATHSPPM